MIFIFLCVLDTVISAYLDTDINDKIMVLTGLSAVFSILGNETRLQPQMVNCGQCISEQISPLWMCPHYFSYTHSHYYVLIPLTSMITGTIFCMAADSKPFFIQLHARPRQRHHWLRRSFRNSAGKMHFVFQECQYVIYKVFGVHTHP